jgi:ribonuclease VapC
MVVHGRRGERGLVLPDDLLRLPTFEIVPPGAAELDAAYQAFVAYGKVSGHPAALNVGDLCSDSLAKV